jgi:dethiobiotin synthetase
MTPRVVFVAGAHTEIGKTQVACALLRAARARGLRVDALKPVVSGFDPGDWSGSDPGRLLAAMGLPLAQQALDQMSPWRFLAPLAPPLAARQEGRPLPFAPVSDFCRERIAASQADLVIVEGVGGLMSPLTDSATSLDLLAALDCRCVLVSGGYLGAVSHALTALEVMRARARSPAAVIVSEDPDPGAPAFEGTLGLVIAHAGGVPVLAAPRVSAAWEPLVLEALGG